MQTLLPTSKCGQVLPSSSSTCGGSTPGLLPPAHLLTGASSCLSPKAVHSPSSSCPPQPPPRPPGFLHIHSCIGCSQKLTLPLAKVLQVLSAPASVPRAPMFEGFPWRRGVVGHCRRPETLSCLPPAPPGWCRAALRRHLRGIGGQWFTHQGELAGLEGAGDQAVLPLRWTQDGGRGGREGASPPPRLRERAAPQTLTGIHGDGYGTGSLLGAGDSGWRGQSLGTWA